MYSVRPSDGKLSPVPGSGGFTIGFVILIILGLGILIFGIVEMVQIFNSLHTIITNQNTIINGDTGCSDTCCNITCIIDATTVEEVYSTYCSTLTTTTEYLFFVNDLEDKITNNYILKSKFCVAPDDTVIYALVNNPNATFPAPNSSTNDGFINGLPNICGPGTNVGHTGSSSEFVASVLQLLNTVSFNTSTVIHYGTSSIQALIGKKFINDTRLTNVLCFPVEVYCYGYNSIYIYTPKL